VVGGLFAVLRQGIADEFDRIAAGAMTCGTRPIENDCKPLSYPARRLWLARPYGREDIEHVVPISRIGFAPMMGKT
jgi:hypothetical protein